MVNTLDHLPLLPLFVYYDSHLAPTVLEQDELGIYHTLQLNGRIRHIQLNLPHQQDTIYWWDWWDWED